MQQLSGFSKQKGDTVILSGKQLRESSFESMFSLTDTLEGHKDEKQRLPTAGNKHIFSNKIMT